MVKAQEQKVEIVPDSLLKTYQTENRQYAKLFCSFISCGIEVVQVSFDYSLPFKVYYFSSEKENWVDTQSIYDTLQGKMPGLSTQVNPNHNIAPIMRMRGDTNTIVIVDGIRYDASILNSLSPADIESVKVSNSPLAQNYFLNN